MELSEFSNLGIADQIKKLKEEMPRAKKEISQQEKLITLAKESPNAWLHEDFLDLQTLRVQEKKDKIKMAEAVFNAHEQVGGVSS